MKKNLLLLAASTLVCLGFAEAASRLLVAARTPAGLRFDGEVLYTYAPHSRVQGTVLNDVGCIGDDSQPRTPGETRVLLLGGSTSFSARYVSAVKAALGRIAPDRRFRVMSCGRPRYTSWVNRVNLERHAAEWAPDVVVHYEGINDNIYNSFPWLDGPPSVGYFDWKTPRTSVLYELLRYHVVDKALRSNPDFAGRPLRSPAIYRENLREVVELVRARGGAVVLATFAIALPTEDETLRSRIRAEEPVMRHFWGNVPSTVAGVQAHDAVVKSLAGELGVPLARVAESMPHDSAHFGDLCHLTDAGNDVLGRAVAAAVAAAAPRAPSATVSAWRTRPSSKSL